MIKIKVFIGADHLGVEKRDLLIKYLFDNGIEVEDVNIKNDPLDDYPDFAFKLGELVTKNNALGLLICGNGVGMSIAANKVNGVRCARVLTIDDAFKSKNHNGCNVISLSAQSDMDLIKEMVDTFIMTKTPNEPRYLNRIEKIKKYEEEH